MRLRVIATVFCVASFVACSTGPHPGVLPRAAEVGNGRHAFAIGGLSSQQYVAANLLIPLKMSSAPDQNANVFTLAGTPPCGPAQLGVLCSGSTAPPYIPKTDVTSYIASTSLTTPCNVTSTASIGRRIAMASMAPDATPSPTPTASPAPTQCYIIAFEGNNGPYIVQGPALVQGTTVFFNPVPNTIHFLANTTYTFYFSYVTAFLTPIPAPTPTPTPTPSPSPSPSPSPKPTPSATPKPSPSPTAVPTATPSPGCGSETGDTTDEHRVSEDAKHRSTSSVKRAEDGHHSGGDHSGGDHSGGDQCHSSPDHSGHGDHRDHGGDSGGDHSGGSHSG